MQLPFMNRWHPELALRYLPMVGELRKSSVHTIVEVGSGGLGIAPYLKQPVLGIDLNFAPPFSSYLLPILGDARQLPLKDHSTDAVISSDMLEHISPEDRQMSIAELFRVAKKLIIIGVPLGQGAHRQDAALDDLYFKAHGHRHHFLAEQTDYGVPELKDMTGYIKAAAKKFGTEYSLTVLPNLNLSLRLWMMRGWISKTPLTNIFFRKVLLLALPLLSLIGHREPTYRQIFVIRLH